MLPGRLLVVMDDEHARGLLVAVLRSDGYTVDAAASRAEALSLIDRHAYALVVSSLRIPQLVDRSCRSAGGAVAARDAGADLRGAMAFAPISPL
jgi:CheY-like chemotaxis protein